MKNLLIIITLVLIFGSSLHSESYHFVANDPYYKVSVKIDSINVYYMNTGKDTTIISSSVHMGTVTTVELNEEHNDVQLYPNPANDHLNIEFISESISSTPISIVDLEGRKLYSQSEKFGIGKHNLNLNIAGLNQGHYFITIGKSTYKFSKISGGNGSNISLAQTSLPTLIKENSTQSQYDYKFTIYSAGFKPYEHYATRSLDRETIIVDLSIKSTRIDGKRIRVEFFFDKAKTTHFYDEHGQYQSYDTSYKDLKIVYTDTLIIRGDSIFSELLFYDNDYYSDFNKITSRQLITLKYDTIQNTISDIKIIRFLDTINDDRGEWHNIQLDFKFNMKGSFQFDFTKSSSYSSIYYLDEKIFDYVNSYKDDYSVGFIYGCIGHKSYYKYAPTNLAKSYIKIEFID